MCLVQLNVNSSQLSVNSSAATTGTNKNSRGGDLVIFLQRYVGSKERGARASGGERSELKYRSIVVMRNRRRLRLRRLPVVFRSSKSLVVGEGSAGEGGFLGIFGFVGCRFRGWRWSFWPAFGGGEGGLCPPLGAALPKLPAMALSRRKRATGGLNGRFP